MNIKNKDHPLRRVKLPCGAIHAHTKPKQFTGMRWIYTTEYRDVIVTAADTHGAIVRRKGCGRYYAPLEELEISK